jgi:two-component system, OmpR family, sensor kinase
MRLFWKVFAVLWLATLLVGVSGFLVSRTLQQDWLLLQFHPHLRDFAEQLVETYEYQGPLAAQRWLETQRRQHRLRAQLYNDEGYSLLPGTLPRIGGLPEESRQSTERRHGRLLQLAWASPGAEYQLTLHVPAPELFRWQRTPFALVANVTLAMLMLALLSLLLSRYLTAPLGKLGLAAQALARGQFDAETLSSIGRRQDEIGDLSRRFQSMAEQVNSLLNSQQQLLRDISHELRSPLARLRLGMALGSKRDLDPGDPLWNRLDRECTRLDRLIEGILALSRLDTQDAPPEHFDLGALIADVVEDARFTAEAGQQILVSGCEKLVISGWPDQLAGALDNLLRNALRFSPVEGEISVSVQAENSIIRIRIDDEGPGVPPEWLERLGEPFARLPGQPADSGHGLGIAIARRAIARHGGTLAFSLNAAKGLRAEIALPALNPQARV